MIETPIRVKISVAVMITGAALFLLGLLMTASGKQSTYFEFKSYDETVQSADVKSVSINIGYGKVNITTGTSFQLSCKNVAEELFEYSISNNVVTINYDADLIERTYFGMGDEVDTTFDIVLPNKLLEEVNISAGSGELNVKGVSCNDFVCTASSADMTLSGIISNQSTEISAGRGECEITSCTLSQLYMRSSTGSIVAVKSRFTDLEYKGSFGSLRISGCTLSGNSQFDTGSADAIILLPGNANSYGFSFDKGRGDIIIDGSKDYKEYNDTISSGDNLSIKNGFGDVDISFGSAG